MKIYRIACLSVTTAFLLLAAFSPVWAQSMSDYTFRSSLGTFTAPVGATAQPPAGGNTDDGFYALAPIGFNFKYNDVVYTQVSASTNGWMRFGNLATANEANNLATGGARPLVAPLWDDLEVSSTGSVSYLTTGVAPNRIFTMQWLNMEWNYQAPGPVISFQVKLYETTNAVQFVYRQEASAVQAGNASIGLAATATGAGNFRSLNNSGANPTASTTTETTTISTKPATGQTYTFTPPAMTTAASVSVSGRVITQSGRGIRNVIITMTDLHGNTRTAMTTGFGYYRFEEVAAGETYIFTARGKRFSFEQNSQVHSIMEDTDDINFVAGGRTVLSVN